jgi:Tol biopolymer transport system component
MCMDRFDKIFSGNGIVSFLPLVFFLVSSLALTAVPATAQIPPDEDWRTLETPHFRVTFPRGMEGMARRAGDRGERAWSLLEERFVPGPKGKVDMVITDHADISNGYTKVFPSNRIVIFAPPPLDGYSLTHMDEWLDLVVTHELVHVFHQDRTLGLTSGFRRLFGRMPIRWPTYPGSATPGWMIEGVATYYESALSSAGRVRGSFHEMILRTAILEGGFESINQVSSRAPVWPGGQRSYVYGSLFLDHLLDKHGEASMGAFTDAVARQWVPFRVNAAARDAFGESFSDAWGEWEEELRGRYMDQRDDLAARAPLTVGEVLTEEGQYALNPVPSPSGDEVAFSRYDSRSDIQLRLISAETGEARKLTRLNRLANLAWTPDGKILLSQTEFADPYRIRNDLYLAERGGEVERLTQGSRLDHPHVAPDGLVAVAIQEEGGTTRLVRVGLDDGRVDPLTDYDPLVHWAYPQWSPDGSWIAAARWTLGAYYDVVILDGEGRVIQEVTRDRAVDISPSWSPDGRWLLWSSDLTGIPNLHAVSVDPGTGKVGPRRQITNFLGGGAYPSVDVDGRWIYYSGYHADGWHIERIPYDPSGWFSPFPADPSFDVEVDTQRFLREAEGPEGGYQPLKTLRPTYWMPEYRSGDNAGSLEVLEPGYGFSTFGEDLVGRHRYALTGLFSAGPGRFNGAASYSWAGLGTPVFDAAVTQTFDAEGPFQAPDESEELLYIVERERAAGLGATFTRRRTRNISSFRLAASHIWEHRTLLDASLEESDDFGLNRPDSRLAEGRASLSFGNGRLHPFSISPEDGIGIFIRGRAREELALADSLQNVAGEDRSFQDAIGQFTLYRSLPLPGFSNHVLAVRGSGGVARGPGADEFHFEVGGASGRSGQALLPVGQGLFFPLRGYGTAMRSGSKAWSASAEFRFPLFFLNGGPGLLPIHLDWLSGSLFMDAGNAWGTELDVIGHDNPRQDPLASVGGELTLRLLPLWYQNMDFRLGVALPLTQGDGARVYLRLGPAF